MTSKESNKIYITLKRTQNEDDFFPSTQLYSVSVLSHHRLSTWGPPWEIVWKCQKSSLNTTKNQFILTVNLLFRCLILYKDIFAEPSLTEKIQFNNSIRQIYGECLLCAWPCRNAKFRPPSSFTKRVLIVFQ